LRAAEEEGEEARMGLEVEAMEVGMGRGDSRMETAACAGRVGEAADAPRTMTCRPVDLSAVKS
jgi:hypothetical protein